MPSYAIDVDPSASNLAFYLIAIMNAASTFGRTIPNLLGDYFGCLNLMVPCVFGAAVLAWCWIAVKSTAALIVWSILYGFFTGCFISMQSPIIVSLSPSLEVIGARMGTVFSIGGLGILIGNPVAGALLNTPSGFLAPQVFCAACVSAAAIFVAITRVSKVGFTLYAKI